MGAFSLNKFLLRTIRRALFSKPDSRASLSDYFIHEERVNGCSDGRFEIRPRATESEQRSHMVREEFALQPISLAQYHQDRFPVLLGSNAFGKDLSSRPLPHGYASRRVDVINEITAEDESSLPGAHLGHSTNPVHPFRADEAIPTGRDSCSHIYDMKRRFDGYDLIDSLADQ